MTTRKYNTSKLIYAVSPVRHFYRLLLKGEAVRCNVCGNTFKKFRSLGQNNRENALCPNCNSLEWQRVLWFYLKNEVIGQKNKSRFLYFNPDHYFVNQLKQFDIKLQTSTINYLNSLNPESVTNRLSGGEFDVILFAHVTQYVTNDEIVFDELKRLLRPGGIVLIMTIINWEMERTYENPDSPEDKDRLKRYFEPGVKRIYGSDFSKRLIKAGFDVEVIDYADQLGSHARNYYQLGNGDRETIFKCKKVAN